MEKRRSRAVLVGASLAAGALAIGGARSRRGLADPTASYTAHGFQRRTLDAPTGRMTYYEAGSGRPLVFLHGIGGEASSLAWNKVAPAFVGGYRVVLPDWVGWGASEHPRRFLLFGDYVADLEALLEHLGEPAVVVAQSLTAGFAADLARRKPGLIRALMLLTPSDGLDFGEDAFGPVARSVLTPLARRRPVNLLLYRLVFHSRAFIGSWFKTQGFYEPKAVSRKLVDEWLWSARRPGAAYSALPFLTGDLRYDFAPLLRDLRVPAVMVWGTEERQVGRKTGERLAAVNPDVPLILIERARATPELELPAQIVAAIGEFVENLPADEPVNPLTTIGGVAS